MLNAYFKRIIKMVKISSLICNRLAYYLFILVSAGLRGGAAVGKKWSSDERRAEIMRVLESRRRETMSNFAFHFGVSIRTICYDVEALTALHPIETVRGKGGCVKMMDGYRIYQNVLTEEQQKTLIEIIPLIGKRQTEVIKEILITFGSKQNQMLLTG